MKIVGCKVAKEISLTPQGANPGAHVLIRKSLAEPAPQQPAQTPVVEDSTNMDVKIAKRVATMNDVTKSYFGGLDDDAATAFLAKSAEDQDKEAEAAKAEKTRLEDAEKAAKEGKTATEAALQKSNEDLRKEVETLKARDAERDATAAIEKAAADPAYDGFPGGKEAVAETLKSIKGLDEASQKRITDGMKAQASLAKRMGGEFGELSEDEIAKTAPATTKINEMAKALSEKDGIDFNVAKANLARNPQHAKLFDDAMKEEQHAV